MSIKTGGCPEDCGYCSQSSKHKEKTGLKATKLADFDEVYQVSAQDASGSARRHRATPFIQDVARLRELLSLMNLASHVKRPCNLTRPRLNLDNGEPVSRAQAALRAKQAGSTRFCMGAAWRGPSQVRSDTRTPHPQRSA